MKNIWPMACRTRCACEPGTPTRSYAELRLSSRPRARYQSRPGVPPSVARRFAATSPIASTITPARARLSTAARAAAASMTSVITCCRRLASRASCRVPDMGTGSADPMLIVISSRSPRNHLRSDPALAVSFSPSLSRPQGDGGGPAHPGCADLPGRARTDRPVCRGPRSRYRVLVWTTGSLLQARKVVSCPAISVSPVTAGRWQQGEAVRRAVSGAAGEIRTRTAPGGRR